MGRGQGQIRVAQRKRGGIGVVDILVVDVRLDMDELTAIGLSGIGTLAGLSYPTRPWIWV